MTKCGNLRNGNLITMENKINIAELLKDCPSGMELDCTMYDNVKLKCVNFGENICYPINVTSEDGTFIALTKYGQYANVDFAKCVIFPKGKTTWEGFVPPCKFKDGDIVFYDETIAIFKEWGDSTLFRSYVIKYLYNDYAIVRDAPLFGKYIRKEMRLATEEEKEKLFQAIKDNGYHWNAETKTLEKLPKFKVGNKIEKCGYRFTIKEITDNYYLTLCGNKIPIVNQDDFTLVPDKFDITTLKPFDKVLVRDSDRDMWCASIFSHTWKDKYFCIDTWHKQCIPYEANKELLGTTNNPKEHGSN